MISVGALYRLPPCTTRCPMALSASSRRSARSQVNSAASADGVVRQGARCWCSDLAVSVDDPQATVRRTDPLRGRPELHRLSRAEAVQDRLQARRADVDGQQTPCLLVGHHWVFLMRSSSGRWYRVGESVRRPRAPGAEHLNMDVAGARQLCQPRVPVTALRGRTS